MVGTRANQHFLIIEVIGGLLTQSLALLSDAAHMFTDTAALAIALAAIQIAKRPADQKRTFGYHRFEILALHLMRYCCLAWRFIFCMKHGSVFRNQQKFTLRVCWALPPLV